MASIGILMMEFHFFGKREQIKLDYLKLQVWITVESYHYDPEESEVIVGKILEHLMSFLLFNIIVCFCVYIYI